MTGTGDPAAGQDRPPVVRDGTAMLGAMTPVLQPGAFVFVSLPADRAAALLPRAVAMLREAEGVSLILPASLADEAGHAGAPTWR